MKHVKGGACPVIYGVFFMEDRLFTLTEWQSCCMVIFAVMRNVCSRTAHNLGAASVYLSAVIITACNEMRASLVILGPDLDRSSSR